MALPWSLCSWEAPALTSIQFTRLPWKQEETVLWLSHCFLMPPTKHPMGWFQRLFPGALFREARPGNITLPMDCISALPLSCWLWRRRCISHKWMTLHPEKWSTTSGGSKSSMRDWYTSPFDKVRDAVCVSVTELCFTPSLSLALMPLGDWLRAP